jgi:PAS domain S-box-containing protein
MNIEPTTDREDNALIRILHVEDNPDLADLAATFLTREDDRFEVETAHEPSEGLDRLADAEFDCIISDYDMPGQNGIEFLKAVREEYPDRPFILFTGKGSEEVASEAISAGVTDYLQKESGSSQYTVLANRVKNAVEQYRAKREIEISQKRFSLFFEQSPLGAIQWNQDFEVKRINSTAADILGYTEEELVGHSWEHIVPESEQETVSEEFSKLLASEGGSHSVNENLTKTGETIVCEWYTDVITDESGEINAIFSKFQDITEEYHRRQRLERQRNALLDLSTDEAVTAGDFETAVQRITETAADVLDVPRVNIWLMDDGADDVLTCVDHFDRSTDTHNQGMKLAMDEYPSYFEALETHQAIAADDACQDPRTTELADDYLDVHDIGALLDGTLRAEGDVVGIVCHEHIGGTREWTDDELDFAGDVADITYRALRNHERREQRQELERKDRAMDAAPVGITISDPAQEDNPLIYVNDRFTEITGYDEAEVLGSNCRFLQGERTSAESVSEMREAIDAAEPVTVELRNYRKDGTEFWNQVSIAPVRTDDGELINYVGFQQDVTAEKERELEHERLLDLLEHTEQIADVGGWEIDPQTQEVFWSDHLFEMLGQEGDDEPPLDEALDVYLEADRPRVETAVEEAIAAGESFDVEARYQRPDGSIRWFRIRGEPTIKDGEVVTLRGAVHDITDHKGSGD